MSVNSIIEAKINSEKNNFDDYLKSLESTHQDGLAFMLYSLKCVFPFLSEENLESGIVDSLFRSETHDYGIDAIYLTANKEIIDGSDELEDYDENTKFTFHIFQFKKGTSIDLACLLKLKDGVKKGFIFNNVDPTSNRYYHERLVNIIELRDKIYEKFPLDNIYIKIYICYSGVKKRLLDDNTLSPHLDEIIEILEDESYSNVFLEIFGGQELINMERESEEIKTTLKFRKSFKYITETEDNKKLNGYIGIVDGSEIGKIVKQWQSSLFEANIRDFYRKSKINQKIFGSATIYVNIDDV